MSVFECVCYYCSIEIKNKIMVCVGGVSADSNCNESS